MEGKQQHGLLPPRTLQSANPFDMAHVDLNGPYAHGKYGITIIDHVTKGLKVGVQDNKEALTTAESFDREWLCGLLKLCDMTPNHSLCRTADLRRGYPDAAYGPSLTLCTRRLPDRTPRKTWVRM
ncbi:unnamed protein product [Peronospora destructor]|uniref:Integrase catalytic domain-containing protein n=1 Tax=Peronospora destructor TaxID=86335 RepID=A0AAV0TTF6_9STRA|nr:unnamed protein product [Peronospora destructor]